MKVPENDSNEFNVIVAGELIFLFYYNGSRGIYIYDLSTNKVIKISQQFPAPYKGKSVALKTSDDFIHFMNASKLRQNVLTESRPYHFKNALKNTTFQI